MAASYKHMYERSRAEAATLQAEINRLRAMIAASEDWTLRELERVGKVVDLAGIARHMRVERYTPQQWRQRGHLPPVDFPEIKEPLWYASTIRDGFAVPSRRVWYDAPGEDELSAVA
jgi:hypothetical protein